MSRRTILIALTMVLLVGLSFPETGQPAATPAKKISIAVGMEPITIDPSLIGAGGDNVVVENWGEFLISKSPSGELKPGLATSWKMSPDAKEIEFTLRRGVRFHSGDSLTAKDVEFTFDRAQTKNPVARTRLKSMDRLEILDDYHFKIHFKSVDVTFIPNRAAVMILSKNYYNRVGEETFVKQPVSTAPYKVVRYIPGQYVDLERFEDYWGEKPPIKEARLLFVAEDTTRLAKLKAEEVDFINSVPWPLVGEVENSPNFKLIKLAVNHPTRGIAFSTLNPKMPWHDRRVRLAMAYAIDWQSIIKNLLRGIPNHHPWLAPHELGYDPSIKPYPYDPKKARELLAEAGYPNGFEFKFYWQITGRVPMSAEICEAIASYFEAVGIKTKLVGVEIAKLYELERAGKKPDSDYISYFSRGLSGSPDPAYYLNLYFTRDGAFSTYYNPEIEKLAAEAVAEANDAKRAELIKKAVRILREDVPCIPIFNNVSVFAMKKNVDFTPTQKHGMDLVLVKDMNLR
jgi:peptide/nickel transport system substrate-binding protein